jgi:hypothetical protein
MVLQDMLLHFSKAFEINSTERTLIITIVGIRRFNDFHVIFSSLNYLTIKYLESLIRYEGLIILNEKSKVNSRRS